MITHICSRVMGSSGANLLLPMPLTILFSAAQLTAWVYQVLSGTSVKAFSLVLTAPSSRYRMVTNMARLISMVGANRSSDTPTMYSFSVTYWT